MAEVAVTARSDGRFQAVGPVDSEIVQSWRKACATGLLAESVWFPDGLTTYRGRIRRRSLADLTVVELEADPFKARWRPGSRGRGYLGVAVTTRTFTERVTLGENSERLLSAPITIWDTTVLAETEVLTPMAQTVLLVPKRVLPLGRCDLVEVMGDVVDRSDTAPLQLLRALTLAAVAQADRMGLAVVAATRNAIVEVLSSVLDDRGETSSAAVSEGMRLSIVRWVEERLHLGQPSPAEVAERHGISVRSLHRLFGGTGESFGAMVRRRRLDRARRDVIATDDMVQSIAMRWGYADASQFISEFKRVHGVTPTAYRQSCREATA
ncbi:helix-turn-helix transcriptional regulator [Streptomyces sp. NPDC093591]|uniref:helix-turn-helix transcriptional regulator n=1 Tax=Streptomyces sp. NPDC093591 TaxID=3366044 RepID=UPI003821BC26